MWKSVIKATTPVLKNQSNLLTPDVLLHQQLRTTFILRRRNAPLLHQSGSRPKRLKNKHYIYDLVQDTNIIKQPDIQVILTAYVEGVGDVGDKVFLRPNYAYNKLLLPGLAVYANPENMKKYERYEKKTEDIKHSSPTSERTVNVLSRVTLSVIMNKEISWTLKPWHIKASFRKCGYHVPENCISMPPKPITGPSMDIENKEFYITITVNNLEKVNVRCRIHHWSTIVTERMPHDHDFWKRPSEPIFPEDAPVLASLPSAPKENIPSLQ